MTKARTLADNYAADINQITASAPLTGGGTSGTVTVGIQAGTTAQSGAVQLTDSTASTSTTTAATPNSVKSAYDLANGAIAKSLVDAKGDLLVGSANDTVSRLAVASTAGYLLTVDSAEATGLKWAAPGATFVGCRIWQSANQTLANATWTVINYDSETFDTDGFHSTSTNTSRITIPTGKGGKYLIHGTLTFDDSTTGTRGMLLYKNGSQYWYGPAIMGANPAFQADYTWIVNAVAGDYYELGFRQASGGNLAMFGGESSLSFEAIYLGA